MDARSSSAKSADPFHALVGAALLTCVVEDLAGGAWHVHDGTFFPWRHLPVFPLYGPAGLVVEWLALALAGLGVALARSDRLRRPAVWLGAAAVAVSLTQRYANGRALLFLVLFYAALGPPATVLLCRAQLVIVYAASLAHKLLHGFAAGTVLAAIGPQVHGAVLPDGFVRDLLVRYAGPLSLATLAAEVAIPVLLLLRPAAGFVLLTALHVGFSLCLPGVAPFGFAMAAMGTTFLGRDSRTPRASRSVPPLPAAR